MLMVMSFILCGVYVLSDQFISIEMEAVAEGVMEMWTILLGHRTKCEQGGNTERKWTM